MNNVFPERQGMPASIIQNACQKQNGILAAYIFGSRAKNTAKPKSDVDIAVLLDEQSAMPFDYLEFKVTLERGLNTDVDLVVLNTAGEAMKHQVRRDGKLVFDQNPRKRKAWEIRSRQLYQDFLHLHSIYMQYFYRSLTNWCSSANTLSSVSQEKIWPANHPSTITRLSYGTGANGRDPTTH